MTKDKQNKPPLDLVPTELIRQVADVMAFGAGKYARFDWRGGGSRSDYAAAAMRHILAWLDGEEYADDSELSHLAHAAACMGILLQWEKDGVGEDDRYREPSSRGRLDPDEPV
jgi:hypothetical protein